MKNLFKIVFVVLIAAPFKAAAEPETVYNVYKPGLSIREAANKDAPVIGKIPYGAKLTLLDRYDASVGVGNEGLYGNWNSVEYEGKKGFVVGIYLFDFPPPVAGTKTMKEYFGQLSKPVGPAFTVQKGREDSDSTALFEKQIYNNGCEYHSGSFYETSYMTYFLPSVTMQKAFMLVRLIPEFNDAFGPNDPYPTESRTLPGKKQGTERRIRVEPNEEKIVVDYSDGVGDYSLEMYSQNGQLVLVIGGGI